MDASNVSAQAGAEARQYSKAGEMIAAKMPGLVKGAGFAGGGQRPLDDPTQVLLKAQQATLDLRTETYRGVHQRADVVKGLNSGFLDNFGYLKTALTTPSIGEQLNQMLGGVVSPDLQRSFTAGNLGIGSVYGLVPFDLRAPSRLIYPVYTVYRNKLPRPPGQGTSMQERVFTGVSGSQTGGQGALDISITELVSTGSSTFATWPLNLPGAGSQTEVNLNVPYRFFGLTEQLSWLAQFAGQGFEDISALANLILLQEMMLNEEYQLISGSVQNLAAPAAPTVTVRAAQSNETALGTTITSVEISAINYFGSTAVSGVTSFIIAAGQVADVVWTGVAGALAYNVYYSVSGTFYFYGAIGGVKVTLQGAAPTSGSLTPPAADTGTGKSTRMEGIIPTLTGLSAAAGIYPNTPSPWQGGYVNNSVGTHLSYNAIYTALKALWDSSTSTPGAFKADPAEIVSSGSDIANLSPGRYLAGFGNQLRVIHPAGRCGECDCRRGRQPVPEPPDPVAGEARRPPVLPAGFRGSADLSAAADLVQCGQCVGNDMRARLRFNCMAGH